MRNTTSISSVLSIRRVLPSAMARFDWLACWSSFCIYDLLEISLLQLLSQPPHHFVRILPLLPRQLLRLRPCCRAKFTLARKYIRHTLIQGNFRVLGEYGPQQGTRGAKFTHDPCISRSLKICHVINTSCRAPWQSGLQSRLPGIPAADPGNLDCNPDYNLKMQSRLQSK
jgi:hypothetical protein